MLTFDLETTNHSYGSALDARNRVLMVAWCEDNLVVRHHVGPLVEAHDFWRAWDRNKSVCAYNAKFEMLWMLRLGVDIFTKHWHDPMLSEKVLLGNRRKPMGLGDVAERYGFEGKDPVIDRLMKLGVCPSEMPQERLLARCRRDVRTTQALASQHRAALAIRNQTHLYRVRADLCRVLAEIETNGMHLDSERVKKAHAVFETDVALLKAELDDLTGGINLRSPDQMAEYLYKTLGFKEPVDHRGRPRRNKPSKQFPDGRPKTDKITLSWLETQATTEKQIQFIEKRKAYGKAAAALSKNLEFFLGVCNEYNGKFHAQFNQTVANTHRLTSSGIPLTFADGKTRSVQFQNMPREFKRLFKAPKGRKAVEVDAKQLEFRVAVYVGQDKQGLKDVFDPDFDAHCTSAAVMNDIPYDQFLHMYRKKVVAYCDMRQEAKPDTFKPLYGGTKGTEKQEKWYAEFQRRYSGVTAQQENWMTDVVTDGELVLPWGMRFFWDHYTTSKGVVMDAARHKPLWPQVCNYPVQELATAEIVPIAIICLHKRCREAGLDVLFVNTIHDSVIAYVADKDVDQYIECAKAAFTSDVYWWLRLHYGIDFNVPLGCEAKIGEHWGEGETIDHDDVRNEQWQLRQAS